MLRCQVEKATQALGLIHPHDRHGAVLRDRMSTAELDAALDAYRQACARAGNQVREHLRALARKLTVGLLPPTDAHTASAICLIPPLPVRLMQSLVCQCRPYEAFVR